MACAVLISVSACLGDEAMSPTPSTGPATPAGSVQPTPPLLASMSRETPPPTEAAATAPVDPGDSLSPAGAAVTSSPEATVTPGPTITPEATDAEATDAEATPEATAAEPTARIAIEDGAQGRGLRVVVRFPAAD